MSISVDTQKLLDKLRKLAIISLFADDDFLDLFVLKGGNALNIAYDINDRASMDLDFSMQGDFTMDLDTVREKISKSLNRTYNEEGFQVFDIKLYPTPEKVREGFEDFWGGYTLEFKVLRTEDFNRLESNPDARQRSAIVVGDKQKKKMKIDISKYEYTLPKEEVDIEGYTVYVYTPLMVVYEKLRALCQQIEEYGKIVPTNRKSRPRDFFDIISILNKFPELHPTDIKNLKILIEMFKVKKVPLYFLEMLVNERDYHSQGFQSVKDTVSSNIEDFDYYFDRVIDLVDDIIQVLKESGLYEKEQVITTEG